LHREGYDAGHHNGIETVLNCGLKQTVDVMNIAAGIMERGKILYVNR
jgi:hypothetical protein